MDEPDEPADISMTGTGTDNAPSRAKGNKFLELASCTIKAPPYSYARLELVSSNGSHTTGDTELDAIQARSYCTAALKQFLGIHGMAISPDILKVERVSCWIRVPRQDLGAFSAAITAWQGTKQNSTHLSLRVKACSDWLGALVGQQGQDKVWSG